MTLGVSLVLNEIVGMLLYTVKEKEDGSKVVVDRELPFRLRYRLNRNFEILEKDVKYFDMQRMILMAKYGNETDNGKKIIIPEEKQEEYKTQINNLIDSEIEHTIMTLEPEDIVLINDTDINVSPDAMKVFIGYMTNDPEYMKEMSADVQFVKSETPRTEKEKDVAEETTKGESVSEKKSKAKKPRTKKTKEKEEVKND